MSKWIFDQYNDKDEIKLFCEAASCEIGDKGLDNKPYINYNGKPIFNISIHDSDIGTITQILRWSISLPLLGIIGEKSILQNDSMVDNFLFICDVIDNSLIIISNVIR